MQVSISGKQIDIGSSLQQYVKDNIERKVNRYFDHPVNADIVFSKESHLFRTDIVINENIGSSTVIKANAQDSDIYSAFDGTINKIQKQLRRYKSRIRNHNKRKLSDIDFEKNIRTGKKYVISPLPHYVEDQEDPEIESDNPVIIAENHTKIEHLSVSEAVMKMDLAHVPALLFINSASGRINVVYHRADGNIAWVDPENS